MAIKMAADSKANLYSHREAEAWNPKKKNLPVTLVTGFLGAGKTTLLKYVLKYKHNLKIAAAVNDFASLNVDGQIIRKTGDQGEVVELSNGCLCCSVSGEFKKAVWKLLQDADIGKVDYLVIETSGVTDPHETISTLEQDYGKMYRIRLDVVVTIVDTDLLVSKLKENSSDPSLSAAADSQLKCADIVLLNKRDLITDSDLELAKGFITSLVPGVRIHPTNYCAVPLNMIMEVTEVKTVQQIITHEDTSAAYAINTMGGLMNIERRKRQEQVSGTSTHSNHLSADGFSSTVFESSQPLHLSKFQKFLKNFPSGIMRMKGSLWFAENRSTLYSFHMSGRYRYEIAVDIIKSSGAMTTTGAFTVQLVVIGSDKAVSETTSILEDCMTDSAATCFDKDRLRLVEDAVKANDYYCLVEEDTIQHEPRTTSDFWINGCIDYGVTYEEAVGFHGINFNRMNEELAKRVNGSSHCVSLLPVRLKCGKTVCRHSVDRESGFEETWSVIQEVGAKIVASYFQAVGVCKCGR